MDGRLNRRHDSWEVDDDKHNLIRDSPKSYQYTPSGGTLNSGYAISSLPRLGLASSPPSYHAGMSSPSSHHPGIYQRNRDHPSITSTDNLHGMTNPAHSHHSSPYWTAPSRQLPSLKIQRSENPHRANSFRGVEKPKPSLWERRKLKMSEKGAQGSSTPFGGVSLRWHSGMVPSVEDADPTNRTHVYKKNDAIATISDGQHGHDLDSVPYGSGWMMNPILNRGRRELDDIYWGIQNSRPGHDPYVGHDDTAPRSYEPIPPLQGQWRGDSSLKVSRDFNLPDKGKPYPIQQVPKKTILSPHQDPYLVETTSFNLQPYHPTSAFTGSDPNDRPGSPSPSSFNFNNQIVPKRSSLPKNFDDLDISIKNEFEKIRQIYDKRENVEEERVNRFSAKDRTKNASKKNTSNADSSGSHHGSSRKPTRNENPASSFQANVDNVPEGAFKVSFRGDTGREFESGSAGESSSKMREDFDEKNRRRRRNHVIFLLIVLLIVAVAVIAAVLAATLGTTKGRLPPAAPRNYSVVVANMTLKILNRNFQIQLLDQSSEAFKTLSVSYSLEIDDLFLRSNLSTVYSRNEILYFRNGSIYATSSITFVDEGLIRSPQDVENVIGSAEVATDWKLDDALQLGEFVVCRSCAEAKLEFVTVGDKPEIKLHSPELTLGSTPSNNQTIKTTTTAAAAAESATTTVAVTTNATDILTTAITLPDSRQPIGQSPATAVIDQQGTTTSSIRDTGPSIPTTETTSPWSTTADIPLSPRTTESAATVITLSNVSSPSTEGQVNVSCEVINPNDWSVVVMRHTSLIGKSHQTGMIIQLEPSGLATFGNLYASRVRATYDISESRVSVHVIIIKVNCLDDGVIECSLTETSGSRTSREGRLSITAPPTRPKLTLPIEVIEKREIKRPVVCEANVGHPPWTMKLTAKLPNGTIYMLPTETDSTVDGCIVRISHQLGTYIQEVNGTTIRCELIGPGDRDTALSDEAVLYIVKETICSTSVNSSFLSHSQNCSLYIQCVDQMPRVLACPKGQCFDLEFGKCGAEALPMIFQTTHGVINQGFSRLACSVNNVTDWSDISIRREGSTEDIVVVTPNGTIQWLETTWSLRAVANFRFLHARHVLEVWIYELKCADAGSYVCRVRSEGIVMEESKNFHVYGRPGVPMLNVPGTVIDGTIKSVTVTCEAILGRPEATMKLKMKLANDKEFWDIPFDRLTNQSFGTCMTKQIGEYAIEQPSRMNGSVFRCDVVPARGVHPLLGSTTSSEEQEFFVLPNSTCRGLISTLLIHPRDCRYFIQCAQSMTSVLSCDRPLCFNVTSQQCDIHTPNQGPVVNSNRCLLENSPEYLPHPTLCNKYIQCQQGREIILHCPQWNVYSRDGTCTRDLNDSFCYNNPKPVIKDP